MQLLQRVSECLLMDKHVKEPVNIVNNRYKNIGFGIQPHHVLIYRVLSKERSWKYS